MLGMTNIDSSFFSIESDDIALIEKDFSKDLISFTVTERMEGLPQGSLQFYDPENIYSRILRSFARLKLSWGYKNFLETPESLIAKQINLDEISGSMTRRGLEVMISNPTGGGDQNGVVTYNCNFTSFGFMGTNLAKKYESGTKAGVVSQAFDELKIGPKRYIDFTRGPENVNPDRPIYQDESTYAFLVRMAREWGCIFKIGWDDAGLTTGIFMDAGMVGVPARVYPSWVGNAAGGSHVMGYKGEINNVKSYTWENNEGESGIGDSVRMDMVNGQIVFRRYIVAEEKVVSYKLNTKKIQEVFQKEAAGGIDAQMRLGAELLSAKDFKSVERFFDPVTETTAPQGYGYRIKAEMLGNPLFSPPNRVVLNNGFPDRIGGTNTTFYLYSVTHKIDTSGYHMSVEVVDAFMLSPTGVPVF